VIVLVLVMVATAALFAWLLFELGRMAVGEFRPPPQLSLFGRAPVPRVPAAIARLVGLGAADDGPPSPRPGTNPPDATEIEPWRVDEEVEGRVYERLYGPDMRRR
jgi:hypothetical protein